MLRRTSGSSLCYRCGRLNRVDADRCFYCAAPRRGCGAGAISSGGWGRSSTSARLVTVVCVVVYVASLGLDPGAVFQGRGPFSLLAPSSGALIALGMAGARPWDAGLWWTLLTAIYLHGSLLHCLFNVLWIRQLAPGWRRPTDARASS